MATLQTCFMAATYGKEQVVLREVMPYLVHRIDPAVAVRSYLHSHKSHSKDEEKQSQYKPKEELSLDEKIRFGQYRIAYHMIYDARLSELVDFVYIKELGYQNIDITILEKGKVLQRSNTVWKEIYKGVQQGLLTITVDMIENSIEE